MDNDTKNLMGKMWNILKGLDQDVKDLKTEVDSLERKMDQKINDRFKVLESDILIKIGSLNVITVGIAFFAYSLIFDSRIDFNNEQFNARFERLESLSIPLSRPVPSSSGDDTQNLGIRETLRGKRGRKATTME